MKNTEYAVIRLIATTSGTLPFIVEKHNVICLDDMLEFLSPIAFDDRWYEFLFETNDGFHPAMTGRLKLVFHYLASVRFNFSIFVNCFNLPSNLTRDDVAFSVFKHYFSLSDRLGNAWTELEFAFILFCSRFFFERPLENLRIEGYEGSLP